MTKEIVLNKVLIKKQRQVLGDKYVEYQCAYNSTNNTICINILDANCKMDDLESIILINKESDDDALFNFWDTQTEMDSIYRQLYLTVHRKVTKYFNITDAKYIFFNPIPHYDLFTVILDELFATECNERGYHISTSHSYVNYTCNLHREDWNFELTFRPIQHDRFIYDFKLIIHDPKENEWKRVVITNGCFVIKHPSTIIEVKLLCHKLVDIYDSLASQECINHNVTYDVNSTTRAKGLSNNL